MATPDTLPSPAHERERARLRRERLDLPRPAGQRHAQWGLALSGGGIRSATFCLGVLQALARSPAPDADDNAPPAHPDAPREPEPAPSATQGPAAPALPLIAQFDYLSTVSGGGYIGGFFSSLFVRGRLSGNQRESDDTAARRAYEALQDDPPARIHAHTVYDPAHPGRAALAWLRDNGRYLAPTGTGDMLYGMGVALRNWAATQYVVGTLILMALALILAARLSLALHCAPYAHWESQLRAHASGQDALVWWSPTWAACALVFLLASGPLGMAFWFSHPAQAQGRPRHLRPDHAASPPKYVTLASLLGAGIAAGLALLGWGIGWEAGARSTLGRVVSACGVHVALAVAWYAFSTHRARHRSITLQRVLLTRWLARSLMVLIVLALLAAVETLAQTAWLWLEFKSGVLTTGLLGALVWALRVVAPRLGDRGTQAFLEKVPLDLLAGVLGVALWTVTTAALDVLLLAVVWFGLSPLPQTWRDPHTLQVLQFYAVGSFLTVTVLALVVGRFPGFLNLSTFQGLYAARLTRAYLGASNFRRFSDVGQARHRDVAEPIEGDSLDAAAPYANPCAPTHFVNVCVNQTVSPGEQLIQRDRKGTPLVIAPRGYYVDGGAHAMVDDDCNELSYPLSFGEWIGVSGAAFATGLGRSTGLGFSLVLGFANVRLGRWWPAQPCAQQQRGGWLRRVFTTQTYLTDEIRGVFFGPHRPYQYLSDGGHFENTGVYELINPARDRGVRLIVVCDCGYDPDFEFGDLANLTRLARIDHGLEIRVNPHAADDELLRRHFADPQQWRRRPDGSAPPSSTQCAVLLDVLSTARLEQAGGQPAGTPVARIILLKPVLMSDAPVDLAQYQALHAGFPHQSTGDQFFDEAQWESYRQLGLHIGLSVFPQDPSSDYAQAFWRVCLEGLPG